MVEPRRNVGDIHPKTSIWPANLLRFHIEFFDPAETRLPPNPIELLREDGTDVSGALVDLAEGLWSADGRWLTALFHPGRVKAGLKAREELGPALAEGSRYQLSIRTAEGDKVLMRSFLAGPVTTCALDIDGWRFRREVTDSEDYLALELDHLADAMSAYSHLRLIHPDGSVAGAPQRIEPRRILFEWTPGAVAVRVDSRFEDPCGNRIGRAFELTGEQDRWSKEPVILPIPRQLIIRQFTLDTIRDKNF